MVIKQLQLWSRSAAVWSTCSPTMHRLRSGDMFFIVALQCPSPVLQSASKCALNSEDVQATFLVAPGLSAMLFRLTKESWSSHALLDAKLLLTDLVCADGTYRAATFAILGDCMKHSVIRRMLLVLSQW